MQNLREEKKRANQSGSGGEGMAARLGRLEHQMDSVQNLLLQIKSDTDVVKERLSHTPTRHDITTALWKNGLSVLGILVVAVGVFHAIFN